MRFININFLSFILNNFILPCKPSIISLMFLEYDLHIHIYIDIYIFFFMDQKFIIIYNKIILYTI